MPATIMTKWAAIGVAAMSLMGRYAAANHAVIHRHVARAVGARVILDIENHHNFAWQEEHVIDGAVRRVVVHRKGATPAHAGALGIIPGSMATASYIVRGLGCDAAWRSCSHGAGRVMTRREARDRVDARALDQRMRKVVYDRRRVRDLVEEAPEVYRDIRDVLDEQRALITPVLRMEPVMVLKG